jgi:ABC-2 type transport system ATP-binding protein
MTSAISISNLTKRYAAVEAVSALSLEVPEGAIFGFLGANGAGKTSTIKVLAGLSEPTSGAATVAGVSVTAHGEHRRHLGYLGQEPSFYGWMSGRQTLEYVAGFHGQDRGAARKRAGELLALVGIAEAADRKTNTYSGGMRQRLGIAQALVGRPAVVMLDEPVSALDPLGRRDVLELMARLRGETTVFYSTHILDDVQRVSDHVAILDHGRLVTAAPTKELMASFTRGVLEVVLGGADASMTVALSNLDGIATARTVQRDGDVWTFEIQTADGRTAEAQRAIAAFSVEHGLTLVSTSHHQLDLEQVFMRLIDRKEHVA